MVKTWRAIGIETEYCNHGKQSSDLVVAFFVPEWAERRPAVLVRKVKKRLEAAGRKVESQIPRMAGGAYAVGMMTALMCQTAYATDIFGVAKSAMQQVYTDVAGLATVGAVVCAAVCLFLMNFSKSGKTVDESRAWLKRIIICWAALMTLGAIVTYMEKILPQSSFTPLNGGAGQGNLAGICFYGMVKVLDGFLVD